MGSWVMGVRVDHSVGVPLFLESCVAPFTCSLEWTLTSVFVDWFRRDLRVSRFPRGPERGSRVGVLVHLLLLLLLLLHLLLPLLPLRLHHIIIDRGIFPPIPIHPLIVRLVPPRLLILITSQKTRLPIDWSL